MIENKRKCIRTIFNMDEKLNIPSYQRGYRWNSIHVIQLIKDILDEYKNNAGYCLQTLIVCKHDEIINVIDGQQRLTTILIIISAIAYKIKLDISDTRNKFTLKYETREKSGDFLKHLMNLSIKKDELDWKSIWKSFCNNNEKNVDSENIDFRYMAEAFITTVKELELTEESEPGFYSNLYDYILDKCFFIWYSVKPNDSEEEQFYKVNMGKIFLSNSDLIKSDFMKPSNEEDEMYFQRITLLSEKWNHIEKELKNPEFWAFIPHNNQYGLWNNEIKCYKERNIYFSRIDEIFQIFLISIYEHNNKNYQKEMYDNGNDRYFLYNKLSEWINTKGISKLSDRIEIWNKIEQLYYDIVELYNSDGRETLYRSYLRKNKEHKKLTDLNDDRLYNLIAYIIYSYSITLEKSEYDTGKLMLKLVETNRTKRRSIIMGTIKKIILDILDLSEINSLERMKGEIRKFSYEEEQKSLNDFYDEKRDKNKKIKNILMLFNLILLDRNTGLSNRYDFLNNRYWGIEHIFSQNEKKILGESSKINELNKEIKELERKYSELYAISDSEEIFEEALFKEYNELRKKVVKMKKDIEKAPADKKTELYHKLCDQFRQMVKLEVAKINNKMNQKILIVNKMLSNEDAFTIRKMIIENLNEYIDSNAEENEKPYKKRVNMIYKLIGFLEKLYQPDKEIIWKEVIDQDFIKEHKDEIIKEMLAERGHDLGEFDSSISELFGLDDTDKKIKDEKILAIQNMLGLDELSLYLDYMLTSNNYYVNLMKKYQQKYNNNGDNANNLKELRFCLEKAAICKFTESKSEINTKIIKKIYEKEVDNYFENYYSKDLLDNYLGNLALLRSKENRCISNSFIEKKEKINKFISEGTSIPYSTLLVFTDRYYGLSKVYNGERIQWLPSSRERYFDDVVTNIYNFCFEENK